ncbi:MAG: 3-dehydroquinate synthase [Ruminococcaceae bacterium]|nr:3-dehydroquinate synthase [Oscillospiraceae bacterium]
MKLPVKHSGGSYDIILERGALGHIGDYLPKTGKALVVTDDGVPTAYARAVADALPQASIVTLKQGEATKNLDCFRFLLSQMLALDFHRTDAVIAVGGGVIGDLAGFAASAYMRGIAFYNIPTTLLSQVDSSIGGKVAVDMDGVKNVVGAFYQPKRVIIDPDVLSTLERRQCLAGLSEAIKMAATSDAVLFERIEKGDALGADLDAVIEGALRIKRDVVERDTEEKNLRKVLNFGHTVGHAIESEKNGAWLHGECVAVGMLPMCAPKVRARITAVLAAYGLPTEVSCDRWALSALIKHDKKASGNGVTVVYVEEIGSFEFRTLDIEEIEKYMEAGL